MWHRESGGSYQFLRVEVVCQGATMFVVLTDADSAPPPLRIDNYSPVSIMFHQVPHLAYLSLLKPYGRSLAHFY